MHRSNRLAQIALAAILAMAITAASASATTIRSGSATGPLYSGSVTASLDGTASFTSGFVNITCNQSTLSGTTNSSGAGSLTSATWTNNGGNCPNNIGGTCASAAQNLPWATQDNYDSGHAASRDGYMVTSGLLVKVDCTDGFGTHTICWYKGNNASGDGAGTQRGDVYNGTNASRPDTSNSHGQLKYPSTNDGTTANLALDSTHTNGFLCSSTAKFSAVYTVTGSGGVDLFTTP